MDAREEVAARIVSLYGDIPLDAENLPFWQGLLRGDLVVRVCRDCGHTELPTQPACRRCLSPTFADEAFPGRQGRVVLISGLRDLSRLTAAYSPQYLEALEEVLGLSLSGDDRELVAITASMIDSPQLRLTAPGVWGSTGSMAGVNATVELRLPVASNGVRTLVFDAA